MAPTILIVDDHPSFRSWARLTLQADGFEVIGEAADGRSGVAEARRLRPDVVLLDVQLPDVDGFEVARTLIQEGPHARPAVVLTSSRDASEYGDEVQRSGADGFVPKAMLSGSALALVLARNP